MGYLDVIILSVIEGVTEFLPISSTGHLVLASRLLGIHPNAFLKSFEIIIQLGAICAVLVLYGRTLLLDRTIIARVLIAFIPTAIVGFTFYPFVKGVLLNNEIITLIALGLGGFVLILFELFHKENDQDVNGIGGMNMWQSFLIGVFQTLSIIPGVSRAASTIIGGSVLRLSRRTAVEFSFLLALPTMAGATGLDIIKTSFAFEAHELGLLFVGLLGSFVTALIAIKTLLYFIQRHTFISFGVYRILLALLFWVLVMR